MPDWINGEFLGMVALIAVAFLGWLHKHTKNTFDDSLYKLATSAQEIINGIKAPEDTSEAIEKAGTAEKLAEVEAKVPNAVKAGG